MPRCAWGAVIMPQVRGDALRARQTVGSRRHRGIDCGSHDSSAARTATTCGRTCPRAYAPHDLIVPDRVVTACIPCRRQHKWPAGIHERSFFAELRPARCAELMEPPGWPAPAGHPAAALSIAFHWTATQLLAASCRWHDPVPAPRRAAAHSTTSNRRGPEPAGALPAARSALDARGSPAVCFMSIWSAVALIRATKAVRPGGPDNDVSDEAGKRLFACCSCSGWFSAIDHSFGTYVPSVATVPGAQSPGGSYHQTRTSPPLAAYGRAAV